MAKYRIVEDIDLHYNASQPRDSHGRWTSGGRGAAKVALKDTAFVVNGKPYDSTGHAVLKSANPAAQFLHQTPSVALAPKPPAVPFNTLGTLKPMPKSKVKDKKVFESGADKGSSPDDSLHADIAPGASFHDAQSWYQKAVDDTDKDNLSTDLGLNPKYRERSIKELRTAIKNRHTESDERKDLKVELAKRVAVAKATAAAQTGFTNKLTAALSDKPKDADLAPIIGETLAAHPQLGAFAHVWDRLRLTGYNFKKKIREGEFTDELPRVVARNVASVLIMFLALHFGMDIPGLGGGG